MSMIPEKEESPFGISGWILTAGLVGYFVYLIWDLYGLSH